MWPIAAGASERAADAIDAPRVVGNRLLNCVLVASRTGDEQVTLSEFRVLLK